MLVISVSKGEALSSLASIHEHKKTQLPESRTLSTEKTHSKAEGLSKMDLQV